MSIEIGSVEVERGEKKTGFIESLELADGSMVRTSFTVVNGRKKGKKVYLGAGIHGDEVIGVEIIRRLLSNLSPELLTGSIIAVPIQNPLAYQIGHRFAAGHLLRSPLDLMPIDMWTSFPGDRNGNPIQIMTAHLFNELMSSADFVLDIHTPTTGGRYAPFCFLPRSDLGSLNDCERLARAFGTKFVLRANRGMYVQDGTLHTENFRVGKPSIGMELGEGNRMEESLVSEGLRGLLNVLKELGMIEGKAMSDEQIVLKDLTFVRAPRSGVLHMKVKEGDKVRKGDKIAVLANPVTGEEHVVKSPVGGYSLRVTTFPTVTMGERVANIGVE